MTRPCAPFARGGEHGLDLDRMVAVIVDDGRALDLADLGEAPLDPAELLEAVGDDLVGDAELGRDADRGERVLDVVAARHRQLDIRRSCATLPDRSRSETSKRLPPGTGTTFSPRTSASAAKP